MSKIFDNVRPNLMMINLPITYWYLIQQTTHLAQKKTTTGRSSENKIINRVSSWRRIYQFLLPKLPLLSSSFPFQVSPFPSFPPFLPPSSLLPPALGASTKSLAGPEIQTGLDENKKKKGTRSSWLNCALRDDEAVNWVSIGHYEAVAVGNWWYLVSRGHLCLYILQKDLDRCYRCLTDGLTDFER